MAEQTKNTSTWIPRSDGIRKETGRGFQSQYNGIPLIYLLSDEELNNWRTTGKLYNPWKEGSMKTMGLNGLHQWLVKYKDGRVEHRRIESVNPNEVVAVWQLDNGSPNFVERPVLPAKPTPIQLEPLIVESQPVTKTPLKEYSTYIYSPRGTLLARRTWKLGQSGKTYITGDGMDLNEYMKQNKWYSGDSDSEFFKLMLSYENPNSEWLIKSGNYRKPGKVYLQIKSNNSSLPTITKSYENIYRVKNNTGKGTAYNFEGMSYKDDDNGYYRYDLNNNYVEGTKEGYNNYNDSIKKAHTYKAPTISRDTVRLGNNIHITETRVYSRDPYEELPEKQASLKSFIRRLFGFEQGGKLNYLNYFK